MTVENCGRQVTFDKRPERVLVIDPEAATLLTAAGAGNKISWYAGYTVGIPLGDAEGPVRAAQHLTDKSSDLTLETIIGARPDVVIGYGAKLIPGLQAAGIQELIVSAYCEDEGFPPLQGDPSAFEVTYRDIETYGKLLGTQDTAAKSVTELRNRVAAVQKQVGGIAAGVSTAALYMYQPLAAYGNKSVVNDQMKILGLKNVFGDTNKRYFEPSVEDIIARNPELVIALYIPEQSQLPTPESVIQDLHNRTELAGVKAIRDNAILPILYYYSGAGVLAVNGLEQLAKQIIERK